MKTLTFLSPGMAALIKGDALSVMQPALHACTLVISRCAWQHNITSMRVTGRKCSFPHRSSFIFCRLDHFDFTHFPFFLILHILPIVLYFYFYFFTFLFLSFLHNFVPFSAVKYHFSTSLVSSFLFPFISFLCSFFPFASFLPFFSFLFSFLSYFLSYVFLQWVG